MGIRLDDVNSYSAVDSTDFLGRLEDFPVQCKSAWEDGMSLSLPTSYRSVKRVIIIGMGGSAIGGRILESLSYSDRGMVSVEVCSNYDLPSYVDKDTLVIACSYSGETKEVLSAFHQGVTKGIPLIVVATGGTLLKEANQRGIPGLVVNYVGEPRSALGYTFLGPLSFLQQLGLVDDCENDIYGAIDAVRNSVEQLHGEIPTRDNIAKQIANDLAGKLVIIYGSGFISPVALRWKSQLNENSKNWAFCEEIPEVHHNSVVGYSLPSVVSDFSEVLLLTPADVPDKIKKLYDVTVELLEEKNISHRLIKANRGTPIEQILTMVTLGDYTSYYLSLLNNTDPSPVHSIDYIKNRFTG